MQQQNQNIEPNRGRQQPRKPRPRARVNLENTRNEGFAEWLYNHRVGLIVVLAAYIVGVVVLFTTRVSVEIPPVEYIIEIVDELPPTEEEIEKLRQQRDELQREIDRRLAAVQQVRNVQSNDAAESEASGGELSYDADMQQMMNQVASDMATNRGDYESGLREVAGIGNGGSGGGSGGGKGSGEKGKFSGAVTVEYSFTSPKRDSRCELYKPAYRAKGGGKVIVDVWINRNGTVTDARIASSTNPELNKLALDAAKHANTLFNIDNTAPTSHRGTITYTFLAQ
ncbi:MAG: TonB family protein [Alistipes sp.]|nr:TonB family protein [Alistipes sp.]